jgi:acyl-CoA reductase-like NAD-dependent aldehyde dehydrogenase
VIRAPTEVSAAERARWLAELAQVLEKAQELVTCLAVAERRKNEALDVCARLEAVRAEVGSLRRSRASESVANVDPDWSKHLPWDRSLPERSA